MVRSLIDIYRFEGWLPDCRMDLCKGYTQGGSNADVVLADSFVKGLVDGIDWETGYEAVLKDAQGGTNPPHQSTLYTLAVACSKLILLQWSLLFGLSKDVVGLPAGTS